MWQKTRSIWAYIHDNYLNDYDYFWLGGDDVYMIVENMRNYLWKLSDSIGTERASKEPLYLGHHIPDERVYFFAGGGPGYVLNRVTVKRLVREVLPIVKSIR